ncbi:MAG: glycosyltransferase family 4 protein [Candidatus Aminicenantaceae bacterium]
MEIHQFATSLTFGDAISDEMLEIQSLLREKGFESEIFVKFYDPRMAGYITDYKEYKRYSSSENIVIFHFSIGSPVSKMFFRIPDKKIMIYHNITPHQFFLDYHRILTRECYKGRLEIKLFSNKVDLALGDSEFNRKELEKAGYSNTGVLPILLNFSKFDIEGNPLVKRIFSNGKTTLLFVGRLIPNKKYEDIIKVFYFYKKLFNPNSQLILAGDYRGMEKYFASLREFIDRLDISDIHFTGHVDFPELVSYYRLSDYYLSMSEHEGFGVPLLEAFYMKKPVIAYAAGAVEETMNGGGVILYKKKFIEVAGFLDMMTKNQKMRKDIIDPQTRALDKYNRENISRILFNHIEQVSKK